MAIEYRFYDHDDDMLVSTSELPVEGGIAVAVLTTGYEAGKDEVVEIAVADLAGNELFSERVKPQNADGDYDMAASGGIAPADVEDAPELYQFEDELTGLFEGASIVVAQHAGFAFDAIEASWVSLPRCDRLDLLDRFCQSHCTTDYPDRPAAVATLDGIAGYYGVAQNEPGTLGAARAVASCYRKLVEEHVAQREAKGAAYWEERDRRLEEAALGDARNRAALREQEIRNLRINALLWLCAAAVFSNLAVQLSVRGFDFGFVLVAAAAAVFFAARWIMCLHAMYKLRKRG